MKTLEEKKIDRFNFLRQTYEKKTYAGLQIFNTDEIAKEIGLEQNEAELVVEYLEGEGLVETHSEGFELVSITHYGKLEIEKALSEPSEPTEHFPPIINFIRVEEMHNSQILQGSTESSQTFNLTENSLENLGQFIESFENRFSELEFKSDDDKNEVVAEIQTLKNQINSPKPKGIIILESKRTLRNILEGMTGSVLATELLKLLLST